MYPDEPVVWSTDEDTLGSNHGAKMYGELGYFPLAKCKAICRKPLAERFTCVGFMTLSMVVDACDYIKRVRCSAVAGIALREEAVPRDDQRKTVESQRKKKAAVVASLANFLTVHDRSGALLYFLWMRVSRNERRPALSSTRKIHPWFTLCWHTRNP